MRLELWYKEGVEGAVARRERFVPFPSLPLFFFFVGLLWRWWLDGGRESTVREGGRPLDEKDPNRLSFLSFEAFFSFSQEEG